MNEGQDVLELNEAEQVISFDEVMTGDAYGRDEYVDDGLFAGSENIPDAEIGGGEESDAGEHINERAEYEKLIRTRFKDLYAQDVQKLINKRFKKYKALEDKVKRLEDEAKKYADIDSLLAAERDRAVSETEERMNLYFKAMRSRAPENAISPRSVLHAPDVSRLTKSERASLASRALKGEKIHL